MMLLIHPLTVLEIGFQMATYAVMENTPGNVTVAVEIRSGQIGTDVQIRVSTADFNPTEAVGE